MSEKNQGKDGRIAGCSISIYPMCDHFVDVILNALEKVNSSKVWMKTDEVSTIIRGRIPHIFDVAGAAFLQAAKTGEHVVLSGTFSVGCPGDTEGHVYMAEDDVKLNEKESKTIQQEVVTKFALYPMGGGDYMDLIYKQIEAMKKHVKVELTHYETKLAGPAQHVLKGLENVFTETEKAGSEHTVMTVTISANSPS
ncbi:MAG: YkoF family thiamine/hydroxymethylpyrimidine-binding protein [Balneolaceae bacterium]